MPAPTSGEPMSFCTQMRALMSKNFAIQKRKPGLTAAEYFVVVCYLLLYYKLLYVAGQQRSAQAGEQRSRRVNRAIGDRRAEITRHDP